LQKYIEHLYVSVSICFKKNSEVPFSELELDFFVPLYQSYKARRGAGTTTQM
jgi:hypothetical protein